MKTKAKIYRVFAAISVLSLMAVVFPALPQQADVAQASSTTIQQQVIVTQTADAPAVTVTQTIACGNVDLSQPRLDYLLNSGCGSVIIAALPNLPHLVVTNSTSFAHIFVQKLPAPPQVRFVLSGHPLMPIESVAFTSSYQPTFNSSRNLYSVRQQNTTGQSRETKTLSELQVQRC